VLHGSIQPKFIVLTYHSIKKEDKVLFSKHIDYLLKVGIPVRAGITSPISNNKNNIAVTFDDGYENVFKYAIPVLLEKNVTPTIFITVKYLGDRAGWILDINNNNYNEIILNEEDVKSLASKRVGIGSHTISHPYLSKISYLQAKKEITHSKSILENITSRKVTLFSFPYGDYNAETLNLAKDAGYERVFLNIPYPFIYKYDQYVVGRINISMDDWRMEYRLKMNGAYQWMYLAIIWKRKYKDIINKINW
ncbi:MAG: polysaccharide deacetylase family protein, partial [Nitrososphaeraceae archaeon]